MKKKFKIWLIHKLGGFVLGDFSQEMKNLFIKENRERLGKAIQRTINESVCETLNCGFKTTYLEDDIDISNKLSNAENT